MNESKVDFRFARYAVCYVNKIYGIQTIRFRLVLEMSSPISYPFHLPLLSKYLFMVFVSTRIHVLHFNTLSGFRPLSYRLLDLRTHISPNHVFHNILLLQHLMACYVTYGQNTIGTNWIQLYSTISTIISLNEY